VAGLDWVSADVDLVNVARGPFELIVDRKRRCRPAGNPSADDLHLGWAAGARAFRLTPR
jgi:hypothetical protein